VPLTRAIVALGEISRIIPSAAWAKESPTRPTPITSAKAKPRSRCSRKRSALFFIVSSSEGDVPHSTSSERLTAPNRRVAPQTRTHAPTMVV
jgi:hypothetical protein